MKGSLAFNEATDIIEKCVAGERVAAIEALEPFDIFHAHFSRKWFNKAVQFPRPPDPACNNDNEFHNAPLRVIKIMTEALADGVVAKINGAEKIYVVTRAANDFRFDPASAGLVGFTAAGWDEAFFAFPLSHPKPAKMIADEVKKKAVVCVNAQHTANSVGHDFALVDIGAQFVRNRKRGAELSSIAALFASKNIGHCNGHFHDMFVCPYEISDSAYQHAAAELFFLRSIDTA